MVKKLPVKSVLIINGDRSIYFERQQSVPIFESAFKDMGYNVIIENLKKTSYLTWRDYDILIYSCGSSYAAINDIESYMLANYITHGGRLILESGNAAAWNREVKEDTTLNRRFQERVLHAARDWVYQDVGDLILKTKHPIATTPNVLPKIIKYTPIEPGDTSGDANALRILSNATGIYIWSHVAYNSVLVKRGITGISYGLIAYENIANDCRIIYYAFDIGEIDNPAIRQKL